MRYISTILVIAGLAISQDIYAQNYAVDALRFSQSQFGSSARLKALGNAQTAVGGDISSIYGNPAGLGLFTRSEFSLTTEVMQYSTESTYFNQNSNASRGRLNLNNLGAVFVIRLAKPKGQDLDKGALSLNFGIGYGKTNDFGNKLRFSGANPQNSIANFYADLANGYSTALEDGSLEDAADQAYLINYDAASGDYFPTTNNNNRVQDEIIIRNGSQSELNLSAGINFSNKFYLGSSIGFLGINYASENTFTEKGKLANPDASDNYTANYYQSFKAEGYGFNLKVGAIFRPSPNIRFGATAQTPSWYTIDDSYSESNNTRLTGNPDFDDLNVKSQSQLFEFTYGLRTPAKFSLGAAFLQNKLGFLTGEIEFVDYSSMELQPEGNDDGDFVEDNRYIINNYKNATNYKIGAEIKAIAPILIRGGYSFTDSPFEVSDNEVNNTADIHTYSLGAGYRIGKVNLDIAYQSSAFKSQVSPYTLNSNLHPVALSKSTRNGIFITIGTRF